MVQPGHRGSTNQELVQHEEWVKAAQLWPADGATDASAHALALFDGEQAQVHAAGREPA